MRLILGHDEELARWAETRFPENGAFRRPLVCLGMANASGIVAVAIYNEFRHHDAQISFVTSTPRWATKGNVRAILAIPFRQWGVRRLTAITAKSNRRCRKLLEGVGFRMEGTHPLAHDGKQASITYGLYRDVAEAKWLKDIPNG